MRIADMKYGWVWLTVGSTVLLIGDFFSGRDIRFSVLYVLPVVFAGWIRYRRTAYTLAICLPILRLLFFVPWDQTHDLGFGIINAVIHAAVLTIMALLAGRARGVTELQKQLKILQGILPICMSCKRIMNEKGEYEQLETFIHKHSEAEFSHGYCPDCMKKIYPQYNLHTND